MPNCCEKADPPNCPFHSNWKSGGFFADHQNWLLMFCDPNVLENSNGRLVKCGCIMRLIYVQMRHELQCILSLIGVNVFMTYPSPILTQSDDYATVLLLPSYAGAKEPASYCFSSGDTGFSNNPCMFSKQWFNDKIRDIALYGEKAFTQNNMVSVGPPRL